MKKTTLLNADISHVIATLGHGQGLTICDAGLPINDEAARIDLALIHGVPSFLDTVKAVLSEMQVEAVYIASEFSEVSPELHDQLIEILDLEQQKSGCTIAVHRVSHEAFKQRSDNSRAVVRTGECTPYANIILQSGVAF